MYNLVNVFMYMHENMNYSVYPFFNIGSFQYHHVSSPIKTTIHWDHSIIPQVIQKVNLFGPKIWIFRTEKKNTTAFPHLLVYLVVEFQPPLKNI